LKHYVPPLLISLALFTLNAGSAMAAPVAPASPTPSQATSRGDAAHPLVMQQAAASDATASAGPLQPSGKTSANSQVGVGGAGSLQREVFGFGLLSSIADPTIG
jgi:hypothetical protein